MLQKQYQCPDCGGSEGYRSRRRNLLEKYLLPVFLLQPVRCVTCYRRSNISMLIDVPERVQKLAVRRQAA
jgi:hypothetical protein